MFAPVHLFGKSEKADRVEEGRRPCQDQPVLATLVAIFTVATALYLFGLPLWSRLFNDVFGEGKKLCVGDVSNVECGNGKTYIEVAESLGRFRDDGSIWGCPCLQGVLGDWACSQSSFSISWFIATAPGTGMMAALTAWPIIAMWTLGAGVYEGPNRSIVRYSLFAFQFFYGAFLVNTLCVWETAHFIVVGAFIVALIVHYSAVAYIVGLNTVVGKYIAVNMIVGILAITVGYFYPVDENWMGQHAFWLGECIGLMAGFSIAPIIMFSPQAKASLQTTDTDPTMA